MGVQLHRTSYSMSPSLYMYILFGNDSQKLIKALRRIIKTLRKESSNHWNEELP